MNISATVVCKSVSEEVDIASKLKLIPGVTINESCLAIGIEFEPLDTMNEVDEMRSIVRLTDIVESVEIHGIVISP